MKIKLCVITIGGLGTRLLPITKSVTKEMLPISRTPAIFMQVKEAYLSGIEEIIFVVSKKNINLIKSFFEFDEELYERIKDKPEKLELLKEVEEIRKNMKFTYVMQTEKGTYGALYSAKDYIKDRAFALMYGDDIICSKTPTLKKLIKEYERTNSLVMMARTLKDLPNFGIVKYKHDNILDSIEYNKGNVPSHDIISGRFILTNDIFNIKDKLEYHDGELQLPLAVTMLNKEIRVVLENSLYFDLGSEIGFLKANVYFGLKNPNTNKELLEFIKEILNN